MTKYSIEDIMLGGESPQTDEYWPVLQVLDVTRNPGKKRHGFVLCLSDSFSCIDAYTTLSSVEISDCGSCCYNDNNDEPVQQ